tara:strand:- start:213 stop:926 length:714 start_codon:yes stop_codon:yes gene_type:complete
MKRITQIFISENNQKISPILNRNSEILKDLFPDYNYNLYNNNSIEEFLLENYDDIIFKTYKKLVPYSYKCDFARYCILYKRGGWYFDLGLKVTKRVELKDTTDLFIFRDINKYSSTSWACASGIIYARREQPILAKAIELIVENTKNNFYGLTPLCPTGPSLWGKAIASVGIDANTIIGDFIELTPSFEKKNKAMVLPDGTIFAFNKDAPGGDLESLGCIGVNNYNDFWFSKNIYGE